MDDWASELRLAREVVEHLMPAVQQVADVIVSQRSSRPGPLPVALCGAQGSGKSTHCWLLSRHLQEAHGLRVASLSLDDLYLTRADREALGAGVHPALATRGVPGTHDMALARAVFDDLLAAERRRVALPAFDKARDDRVSERDFPIVEGPFDVVMLEGWCVGAQPETDAALRTPLNDFERKRDPDGRLRQYVQAQLAGAYADLFQRFELLVMLKAPDMDCVVQWRTEQEHALAQRLHDQGRPDTSMSDAEVARFVEHFERLTRHMLDEMPGRADVVVHLDPAHRVDKVTVASEPG